MFCIAALIDSDWAFHLGTGCPSPAFSEAVPGRAAPPAAVAFPVLLGSLLIAPAASVPASLAFVESKAFRFEANTCKAVIRNLNNG